VQVTRSWKSPTRIFDADVPEVGNAGASGDFWRPCAVSCRRNRFRRRQKLDRRIQGKVKVGKMDVDTQTAAHSLIGTKVTGIPPCCLKNGQVVENLLATVQRKTSRRPSTSTWRASPGTLATVNIFVKDKAPWTSVRALRCSALTTLNFQIDFRNVALQISGGKQIRISAR